MYRFARTFVIFLFGWLYILPAAPAVAQGTTRVVVWHAYRGQEQEALEAVAQAFERTHPDLQIALVAQPFGAYASKLESAIPTGHGPDLFIDAHDRFASYLSADLIAEIPTTASERDQLDPRALDAVTYDTRLFGLPLSLKCAALYVAPGYANTPFDSLESLSALRDELPDGHFALAMEAESAYWAASLFHAYGSSLIDAEGAWSLRGDAAEAALAHLNRLVTQGVVPEESSGDLVKRLFADGRAATAISGPWLAADLPAELNYTVRPLPTVQGAGGEPMRPFVTVESVFLSARATHAEAAAVFADFLAVGEGARTRALVGGQVVTDRAFWNALGDDEPTLRNFYRAAQEGVITPTHPHMRMAFIPAQRAIRKVLRGTATIPEALLEGQHRFEDLTRPLPPEQSWHWAALVLGLLLLFAVARWLNALRAPEMRRAIRRSMPAYRYVAHAAVAVGLLVILPLVVGAATSFFAGHGRDGMYFVGFANYLDILTARGRGLLSNGSFWLVLLVTILWTVLNVFLHLAIGVVLALLLHRPYLRMKALYRVLLILPWAVPSYVTALAWRGMFHRQFGAVNAILTSMGAEPIGWFSQWITAFSANVATNVWLGFPFMMVVTLGALTAIPKDVYEAAAVDGATPWQRFTKITVPLLGPFLAPAVAMGSVWTFNMFNVVFLVSGGEPDGSTEILVSEAYRWAFTRNHQYGYAAAYAVLIFLILLIGTRSMARSLSKESS